jgi:uncharacterized protein (UPF0332 family)
MPWRDHLEKARMNLRAAEVCYREDLSDPAVSRAYYGVFHAAIAALLRFSDAKAGRDTWDHGNVQAEFNRQLVSRRKLFAADLGRILSDLLNYRHVADYRRVTVGKKVAGRCLEKARRFISAVDGALKED